MAGPVWSSRLYVRGPVQYCRRRDQQFEQARPRLRENGDNCHQRVDESIFRGAQGSTRKRCDHLGKGRQSLALQIRFLDSGDTSIVRKSESADQHPSNASPEVRRWLLGHPYTSRHVSSQECPSHDQCVHIAPPSQIQRSHCPRPRRNEFAAASKIHEASKSQQSTLGTHLCLHWPRNSKRKPR